MGLMLDFLPLGATNPKFLRLSEDQSHLVSGFGPPTITAERGER